MGSRRRSHAIRRETTAGRGVGGRPRMTDATAAGERPAGALEGTGALSPGRRDWATWPKYEAAVLGFRDYWYPVTWSKHVGKKPIAVTVGGEQIMLIRE